MEATYSDKSKREDLRATDLQDTGDHFADRHVAHLLCSSYH
jgi:hypothetical protein